MRHTAHFQSFAWLAVAALALVCGCSSSSSASAADAGTPNNTFKCGGGAYKGIVRITDPKSLGPVAGAVLAGAGCETATADDRGYVNVASDPGLLVKFTVQTAGYLNEYAEITLLKDQYNATTFEFEESTKTTLFTPWSDANGFILVATSGDGSDGGPCAEGKGSTVSVKGHPEIAVAYLSDNNTRSTTLTSTAGFGTVLGPMPPGTYELLATKTGCKGVGSNDGTSAFGTSTSVLANTLTGHLLQLAPM
jgi:hypothetical protein